MRTQNEGAWVDGRARATQVSLLRKEWLEEARVESACEMRNLERQERAEPRAVGRFFNSQLWERREVYYSGRRACIRSPMLDTFPFCSCLNTNSRTRRLVWSFLYTFT